MKYFLTIFITAVLTFLAATVYYKGIPEFAKPEGVSVSNTEVGSKTDTTPSPAPVDEENVLAEAVKTALVKKYGSQSANLKVSVSKIEGEYAEGTVSEDGGGGGWFAARQNGFWTLVWDGNGQIDCVDISPYPEFPASLIPECWDSSADKLITR